MKVVKFLLGCANRLPEDAARHFKGYAVLVIGAQQGEAGGVARGVELHELEDRLRLYLGAAFPGFEFGRIGVEGDREVLFVLGLPPGDGQPINGVGWFLAKLGHGPHAEVLQWHRPSWAGEDRNTRLRGGLRQVISYATIFHWNRFGFTARTQAILAHAARTAILGV